MRNFIPDEMKKNNPHAPYITPMTRTWIFYLEKTILSNTEPIGGKDDPDHEW